MFSIAETVPPISKDVMKDEPLFLVFDAAMMLVSIGLVTILHPCIFFPYLGVKKSKKNQGKVYEDFRMSSDFALVGHTPQYSSQQYSPQHYP